jgi:hypothetical protein
MLCLWREGLMTSVTPGDPGRARKGISFYDDVMQGLIFFSSPFFFFSL